MLLDLLFHHEQGWWNTSHGTSPPNLKFTPIRDGYVVKTTTSASSGSLQRVRVFASSNTSLLPTAIGSGSCISRKGSANAFVRPASFGEFVSVSGARSSGGAGASISVFPCTSGFDGVPVSAGVSVCSWSMGVGMVATEGIGGYGVRNPSDEEIATLAYMLSRKRLTRCNNNVYTM